MRRQERLERHAHETDRDDSDPGGAQGGGPAGRESRGPGTGRVLSGGGPKRRGPRPPAALGRALGGPLPRPGMRVGLLGGSFNPAHPGHVSLSKTALARLALDEVWWLVSPQNPLKPKEGMAALDRRVARARAAADHPNVRVTALELDLGTRYSVDTVEALTAQFPRVDFVWLMGADSFAELPLWKDWERLFRQVAIAVFDRPGHGQRALAAPPAAAFAHARLPERQAKRLAGTPPPAWVFIHWPLDPSSSTALRQRAADRGEP